MSGFAHKTFALFDNSHPSWVQGRCQFMQKLSARKVHAQSVFMKPPGTSSGTLQNPAARVLCTAPVLQGIAKPPGLHKLPASRDFTKPHGILRKRPCKAPNHRA